MKAIVCSQPGGPEVMRLVDAEVGPPGPGEVRVAHSAIGVNYIDTYHRTGLYPLPMPFGIGVEAAGVVEAVGEGVTHVHPGQRIVYFTNRPGSYATHRLIEARWAVPLADSISDQLAAAIWLKACTVEFLVERCARVQPGDTVLVQAAAGGVGVLLVQWLKSAGATVIGTAGSEAKRAVAREAGSDHVLAYNEVPACVRELTGGAGVNTVIDGVGRDSFEPSLQALGRRGLMISYGNASGPVGAVDFALLARHGSLFATRPTLFDYYATPEDFAAGSQAVFAKLGAAVLRPVIGQTFALADAADCHRALEARETTGASLLIP